MRNVGLAAHYLSIRVYGLTLSILRESCSSDTTIVGPSWVHVQTEYVTFGLLHTNKQLLEIIKTSRFTRFVVVVIHIMFVSFSIGPLPNQISVPTSTVKIVTRRIHHTMQNNLVTVLIHQPATFNM